MDYAFASDCLIINNGTNDGNTIFVFIGLPKGGFIRRKKAVKPGRQAELGEDDVPYEYKDLFVGNVLDIDGFKFQIISADEFTLSYMEANRHLVRHFLFLTYQKK